MVGFAILINFGGILKGPFIWWDFGGWWAREIVVGGGHPFPDPILLGNSSLDRFKVKIASLRHCIFGTKGLDLVG